ncbi:MAG: NADH-quinone oxidoreductase subunit N [Candidatus Rokubacteria bacterium]|nr:NADH-quinone oxidoreductase subunit N [Candidatus Rokubacteria bacterium]MBI2878378.1 NADH-quinone oxidoreductase subunit N [Candidatus Rokubacteria bacterium]
MELAFPVIGWRVITPMLLVTGTGFACLLLDLLPPKERKGHVAAVGLLGLALAGLATGLLWGQRETAFREMVALDEFALFFNLLFCVATGLVLLLSHGYIRRQGIEQGEYYILVLFAALGMMLMAAGTDLLIIFLGLELMSLSLYVLAGFFRTRPASNESAMKYFLLGAFATGFFLYGIALIYGATGTTSLPRLAEALARAELGRDPLLFAGLGLLLVGFGFKISSVPFHMWAPDVYEGAPTAITALIATGSKAAAFAALLRVLLGPMRGLQPDWLVLVWILAALTMTLGNVVAIAQSNLKRMLAYSSIAHVGYMLIGVVVGTQLGAAAVLYYLAAYTFMTAGAFGVILLLERRGAEAVQLGDYAGLAARHPLLALLLALFLLSLIGFPPTAGFVGKFYLFSAAIEAGYVGLAILAVLNAVIASYYYLRLIVYMYMREPEGEPVVAALTPAAGLGLAVAVWGTLHLGLAPGPLIGLAQGAVGPFLP